MCLGFWDIIISVFLLLTNHNGNSKTGRVLPIIMEIKFILPKKHSFMNSS